MLKGFCNRLYRSAERSLNRYKEFPFWYVVVQDMAVFMLPVIIIVLTFEWFPMWLGIIGIIGYPFFSFLFDCIVVYVLKDESQAKGYGGRFIM